MDKRQLIFERVALIVNSYANRLQWSGVAFARTGGFVRAKSGQKIILISTHYFTALKHRNWGGRQTDICFITEYATTVALPLAPRRYPFKNNVAHYLDYRPI